MPYIQLYYDFLWKIKVNTTSFETYGCWWEWGYGHNHGRNSQYHGVHNSHSSNS